MNLRFQAAALAGAALVLPAALRAQFNFPIEGREVQIHSFISQGFAYSDENNYLTMKTSQGSFAMTDAGVSVSMRITDNFHAGAQVYDRCLGKLGDFHPSLDWAFGDYQFKRWLGVRAGKVKTVLGLYNDSQDVESLHTWAILPQSTYPLDLRASTIAHTGADVYGTFAVKNHGDISYTGYVGSRSEDKFDGYEYGVTSLGLYYKSESGRYAGGDLRWNNLVPGLLIGSSFLSGPASGAGNFVSPYSPILPVQTKLTYQLAAYYVEYRFRGLTIDGEYRREVLNGAELLTGASIPYLLDQRGWYASASYRISRLLEVGTYHSRFYPLWDQNHGDPEHHIFDQTVTARLNLTRHWDLKIEGHFIDGYGLLYSLRGFYPQDNPHGLKPRTNLLVVRTGWTF